MKEKKVCPKCGSEDIAVFSGIHGFHSPANHMLPLGSSPLSAVPVSRYVCLGCGFVEEWIEEKGLRRLREAKLKK